MKLGLVHSGWAPRKSPLIRATSAGRTMSEANRFRHQLYTDSPPHSPYEQLQPGSFPPVGSDEFRRRMLQVGDALRDAGVGAICLVHGTFAGLDALGILAELGRWYPAGRDAIGRIAKRMVDAVARDAGNYTAEYAASFEEGLHRPGEREIPVRLFHWSSENHHVGRADAAVRLVDELASLELESGRRVLLWGHSHAGNVFALLTNLLAGDRETIERFFEACRVYYRWPVTGVIDIPVWHRTAVLLAGGVRPMADNPLDIVTFGTPIRYGWDRLGYGRLLHFVNHRPVPGLPPYRALFPPKLEDVLGAAGGDYVQQVGIAGTNTMPSMLAWRAWSADQNLNRLLQGDLSTRDLVARLQLGMRVAQEGTTLLVDYGPPQGNLAQHLAGHAVYTRHDWLVFHAEEVARRFYALTWPE